MAPYPGSAALKRLVTDAVNARFAPIRSRRAALVKDRPYLHEVLRSGNARVRELSTETLEIEEQLLGALACDLGEGHAGGQV